MRSPCSPPAGSADTFSFPTRLSVPVAIEGGSGFLGGEAVRSDEAEQKGRILVVDDNEDNRDMLSRRLTRKGYDAPVAEDGASALERIAAGGIDLVLLDVMMPGMSGVECLQKIREEHPKTRLPVIMATAKTESKDVVEALNSGANDYVTKPIDFPILLARVESQLSIREEAAKAAEAAEAAGAAAAIDLSAGLREGTVVNESYEIRDMIGHGGFAAVYRAKQLSTGQMVALKCLSPDRVARDPSSVEVKRFIQEMKLIGTINHPNVVRLIDSGSISCAGNIIATAGPGWSESPVVPQPAGEGSLGETVSQSPTADRKDDVDPISRTRPSASDQAPAASFDVPYIVMEYLEGGTLADLLTEREVLDPSEAIDILLPVIGALSAAHDEGVVHRDIKPANIFLVTDKKKQITPKVLDFGIAKLVERAGEALTIDDSFIGTPEYMAPEQGRGERDLDPRADQFSVAAILYHAVTGRKLYVAGSLIGLVRLVSEGEFKAPRAIRDDIPEGLEQVMLRALDRDRDRRFTSVVSFGKALLPYASEATQRLWQDRLAHPSDPAPAPRPRLKTRGETPNALAREQEVRAKRDERTEAEGPVPTVAPPAKQSDPAQVLSTPSTPPSESSRPSADDTRKGKVVGASRPSAAPQQPPMWMWLALLATLAGLGFAAVSLGL